MTARNKGRDISIVLCWSGGRVTGSWSCQGEETVKPVTVDGEDRDLPWRPELWTRILSNLRFNPRLDRCRLLVYPFGEETPVLPSLDSAWEWTVQELSGALEEKPAVGRWQLNGEELQGRYRDLFPGIEHGPGSICRMFTAPALNIAPAGEGRTSLFEIMPEAERRANPSGRPRT